MSPYDQWQLENYGNILPSQDLPELEAGNNEAAAFEYWMRCKEESLLIELEERL